MINNDGTINRAAVMREAWRRHNQIEAMRETWLRHNLIEAELPAFAACLRGAWYSAKGAQASWRYTNRVNVPTVLQQIETTKRALRMLDYLPSGHSVRSEREALERQLKHLETQI